MPTSRIRGRLRSGSSPPPRSSRRRGSRSSSRSPTGTRPPARPGSRARRARSGAGPTSPRRPEEDAPRSPPRERQHLRARRQVLREAPGLDAQQVQAGEERDEQRSPSGARSGGPREEPREVLAAHHARSRRSPRSRCRAPRSSRSRTPCGGRTPRGRTRTCRPRSGARRELGEDERAQQPHQPAERPRDEREAGPPQLSGDDARRAEDARAHHDPDDHGEAVERAERSAQSRCGGGRERPASPQATGRIAPRQNCTLAFAYRKRPLIPKALVVE